MALSRLALRSAVLSCSHRTAEGQGARSIHHPRQPLLPGSLWPCHESSFSTSHGCAAEQERYCEPFCIPRPDAFHRLARACRQLGLLSACPWVCADVAGSYPSSPSLLGHSEVLDTLCPELWTAHGQLHLGIMKWAQPSQTTDSTEECGLGLTLFKGPDSSSMCRNVAGTPHSNWSTGFPSGLQSS